MLIPDRLDTRSLGCHNPPIADRVVFDKLIQVLVLGAAYGETGRCYLLSDHDPQPP